MNKRITRERAVEILKRHLKELDELAGSHTGSEEFLTWYHTTMMNLKKIFGDDDTIHDFKEIFYPQVTVVAFSEPPEVRDRRELRERAPKARALLRSLLSSVEEHWESEISESEAREIDTPKKEIALSETHLYSQLITYLNKDELKTLCFKLKLDYETLPDNDKRAMVRELIEYCKRHGLINDLREQCREDRPHVDW